MFYIKKQENKAIKILNTTIKVTYNISQLSVGKVTRPCHTFQIVYFSPIALLHQFRN